MTVDRLPLTGQVAASRCFASELALLKAYKSAEDVTTSARYRSARMRDEAREHDLQAEHLRRSAFEAERDAASDAVAVIANAPR